MALSQAAQDARAERGARLGAQLNPPTMTVTLPPAPINQVGGTYTPPTAAYNSTIPPVVPNPVGQSNGNGDWIGGTKKVIAPITPLPTPAPDLFPGQQEKPKSLEQKGQDLIDGKANPTPSTPAPNFAAEGSSAVDKQYIDRIDAAKKLGIDTTGWPTNAREAQERQGKFNAQDYARASEAANTANQLDANALGRQREQTTASEASVMSQFAQGAEGAFGSSNALVSGIFNKYQEAVYRDAETRYNSAVSSRAAALEGMKRAQEEGDMEAAGNYKKQLDSAEAAVRQSYIDAGNVATQAAKAAADIAATEATTARGKSQDFVKNLETFAPTMSKMSDLEKATTLSAMIRGTDMTLSQAIGLQMGYQMKAEAANIKDIDEHNKAMLTADKMIKENQQIGKPSAVQEYEYMNNLDSKGQAKFLELKNGGYSFTKMENGTIVATNQNTGKAQIAFTPEEMAGNQDFNSWSSSFSTAITQDWDNPASYIKGRTIHGGVDLAGAANSPVTSPISGKVVEVTEDNGTKTGWGNSVVIDAGGGRLIRMAHFNSLNVGMGDTVSPGQLVGLLGNTGYTKGETGNHVHMEVKENGELIDPRTIFGAGGVRTIEQTKPKEYQALVQKAAKAPEYKTTKAFYELQQSLSKYRGLVDAAGALAIAEENQPSIRSAYADLKVKWKEAANLGALTGPDLGLIEDAIPDITSKWNILKKWLPGDLKKSYIDAIDSQSETISTNAQRNLISLANAFPQLENTSILKQLEKEASFNTMKNAQEKMASYDPLGTGAIASPENDPLGIFTSANQPK